MPLQFILGRQVRRYSIWEDSSTFWSEVGLSHSLLCFKLKINQLTNPKGQQTVGPDWLLSPAVSVLREWNGTNGALSLPSWLLVSPAISGHNPSHSAESSVLWNPVTAQHGPGHSGKRVGPVFVILVRSGFLSTRMMGRILEIPK